MGKELSLNILEIAKKVEKLEESGGEADDVTYDPTASHLEATNVQDAIDELSGEIAGLSADDVSYDGTDSGLSAVTVQSAIDETVNKIENLTASQVMLSDNVTSVEDALDGLTASAFGTSIALTANTPITATSDGYVVYSCGATSGNYCYLYINDVNVAHATYASNLATLPSSCLFVKKGMTIKFEGVNAQATFYPLT